MTTVREIARSALACGCTTCADRAEPMQVMAAPDRGVARCRDRDGADHDVMVDLVDDIASGAWVLVHAGTALRRLGEGPGV